MVGKVGNWFCINLFVRNLHSRESEPDSTGFLTESIHDIDVTITIILTLVKLHRSRYISKKKNVYFITVKRITSIFLNVATTEE